MRRIEFVWHDEQGWICRTIGSVCDGDTVVASPDLLPRDASPEAVVATWLRGRGVALSDRETADRDHLVAQMVVEGASNKEVGAAAGISPNHVTKIVRRLGIERERGRPAKCARTANTTTEQKEGG